MTTTAQTDPNEIDMGVEDEIKASLSLDSPKSFFLYAGAGSGKTRSLVNALQWLREKYGRRLLLHGQRIGVITYTNAARDEITERIDFDVLIEVSTIHSFAWSLIGSYQEDIRAWLRQNLITEVAELVAAQVTGRAGTKAALERTASIQGKTDRLAIIDSVKRFQYSPTGENRSKDSLTHTEVIKMTVAFLLEKETLQNVLVRSYPILLIDESQDTNRHLMDALLKVQQKNKTVFSLGLFGDTMQRIYADGKVDLDSSVPADWLKPVKKMNHRSPGRVLRLLNQMRTETDHQEQQGRTDKPDGIVRLFLLPANTSNKPAFEAQLANRMATLTGDTDWTNNYKALILEHHMAAKRLGFSAMFDPLYRVGQLQQGLLDGSLQSLNFFAKQILPLVEAMKHNDRFAAAAVVKKYSPMLDATKLRGAEDQRKHIADAKEAVDHLMALWDGGMSPTMGDVLDSVYRTQLFDLPEILRVLAVTRTEIAIEEDGQSDDKRNEAILAWEAVLETPFVQVGAYDAYILGNSPFDTHQGVKGREFPRVMVIIDDGDARGFMFSYEKLFGVKQKTATDLKNEQEGVETGIDRTRRLLYVTCSRAKSSLALVVYTENPALAKAHILAAGWFSEDEIISQEEI